MSPFKSVGTLAAISLLILWCSLMQSATVGPAWSQIPAKTQKAATTQKPATGTAAKTEPKYLLRYKLRPGETLLSKVIHFANTRTKIQGLEEDSESRTTSEKQWQVKNVDANGNMVFEYRINAVDMAQRVGEGEEIKYNSRTDTNVPEIYQQVSETLNKPLSLITMNPQGQVVNRDKEMKSPQLGMGELALPLPAEPIAIGGQWSVPRETRVKLEDGTQKVIKLRELYTLEKVSAGVATISIETQPLTPISDPAIDSQIIQQLSKGQIKFDLDNGRMLSKQLDWSDVVVGFRGPDTSLKYDSRLTEELVLDAPKTATKKSAPTR